MMNIGRSIRLGSLPAMLLLATRPGAVAAADTPPSPVATTAHKVEVRVLTTDALLKLPTIRPYVSTLKDDNEDKEAQKDYRAHDQLETWTAADKWEREQKALKKLTPWEIDNGAEAIRFPYGSIGDASSDDGMQGTLGELYYVNRNRTVYGPGMLRGSVWNKLEMQWQWTVPSRIRLATWDFTGTKQPFEKENLAAILVKWFDSSPSFRVPPARDPVLFRFDKNGLQWQTTVPYADAINSSPPAPRVDGYHDDTRVMMTADGKTSWLVSSRSGDVWAFVYSEDGTPINTLKMDGFFRFAPPLVYNALGATAFLLELSHYEKKEIVLDSFLFDAKGTPLCRLTDAKGRPVSNVDVSRDGYRAWTETCLNDEVNKRVYFRLELPATSQSKPK